MRKKTKRSLELKALRDQERLEKNKKIVDEGGTTEQKEQAERIYQDSKKRLRDIFERLNK